MSAIDDILDVFEATIVSLPPEQRATLCELAGDASADDLHIANGVALPEDPDVQGVRISVGDTHHLVDAAGTAHQV